MERLTYRDANGELWYSDNGTERDRLHRLAAYEDTGLTPEEVQQMRWIPVEERLPEKHSEYIVCACDEGEPIDERIWGDTVVVCADYYDGGFTWYEGNTEYDISDIVTHWMPLPQPPKDGTNGKH